MRRTWRPGWRPRRPPARYSSATRPGRQARLAQNQAQLESLLVLMESKPEGMSCQDNAARVLEQLGQATGGERGLCSKDFWQAP